MPNINCSSILFNKPFNTNYDFTVSFTYTMSAGSTTPVQNNGFSVFFINGNQSTLVGGGSGQGLGIISNTNTTSTSAVSGVFAALGFDVLGTYSKNANPFTSGNVSTIPYNIGLRTTSDFTFINSIIPTDSTLFYPYNTVNTIRISVRNQFRTITISKLYNSVYKTVATFDSTSIPNLGKLPQTGKFGIGFSGDTLFNVQDINLNYS